jgi:hypothetical protein
LRELPFDTAIFIDLVASGTLRSLLEQSAGSTKALERVLERYQSVVADCMDREGGVIGMSDGYSFLIGFPSVASAIRCALLVQENLVVQQPIVQEQFGPVQARIAIHMKGGNGNGMTVLLKGASRIASRAQADQVLISGEANKKLVEPLENVSFRARSERVELGSEKQLFDEEILEVERVVPVVFTAEERTSLFKQNPASRSGGGFQAFLVGLQERVNAATNTLELRLSDRERIARYAHDYKGGGWQGRLSKIFGRTLGKDLGRR